MIIEIHPARLEEQPVLRGLMELYQYDLSEFERTDVNDQGSFGYRHLDDYWIGRERHPFLVRVDGRYAGFALVRQVGEREGEPEHEVADFFVLRRYRRRGVGRSVAFRVFDMFPGGWRVEHDMSNAPAHAFWRAVISEYARGRVEDRPGRLDGRPGRLQRFHSRQR